MHYYKRNIGDYAKKAGKLTMLQHGAYTLLIDACYDRERFPTLEDAIDWTWAETDEEKQAVHVVLRRFFTLVDGFYVQDRITEELESYRALSEVNSRIARQREEDKRARSVLKRAPVVHESAPNHEPLTTNHKPVTNSKTTRGTRLSTHFEPDFDFAKEQGIQDYKAEYDKFKDYWLATGGQRGVKLDWQATWRNWCRSAKKPMQARYTPPKPNETVPARQGVDPALAKLIADGLLTKPMPPELRAKLNQRS